MTMKAHYDAIKITIAATNTAEPICNYTANCHAIKICSDVDNSGDAYIGPPPKLELPDGSRTAGPATNQGGELRPGEREYYFPSKTDMLWISGTANDVFAVLIYFVPVTNS